MRLPCLHRPRPSGAIAALTVLAALAARPAYAGEQSQAVAGSVIPRPAVMTAGRGTLHVGSSMAILVPAGDAQARFAADRLARRLAATTGIALVVRDAPPPVRTDAAPAILLSLHDASPVAHPSGYTLDVTPRGIRIAAADEAGLFYGLATLGQMLDDGSSAPGGRLLPETHLRDWPRFVWRGFMLDSARHFQDVDYVEHLLDRMADHKMNVFHWHLTDDQGWRIEIKRYPDLTRIGAWRQSPVAGGGETSHRYGGFYTQAQIRHIVAYAGQRHITVVPEIDMPGHAQAMVAAYPSLGVTGTRPPVAVDWGVNPYLLNVEPSTFVFLDGVLDEVMELFPSAFIHVGGDEAIKDQWRASPKIQARIRALGLKNEDALQSWFIERIGRYLAAHGRRLIGWDEILDGGIPPSASIMSWRGEAGAIEAASLGHDSVLSPAPTLYFDGLQSPRDDEPAGRRAFLTLLDLYSYDPLPAGLSPDVARHVLGLQANLFTEYMTDDRHAAYATYPRLDALSEIAWTPQQRRDPADFLNRLDDQMARYRRDRVPASDSAFAVAIAAVPDHQGARITLSSQTGFGTIRFTRDGSTVDAASPPYTVPFAVALPTTIQAAAFDAKGRSIGDVRTASITDAVLHTVDSAHLHACPHGALGLRVPLLPDATAWAPVYDVNLFDECWIDPDALPPGAARVDIAVGRLPRTYGLAADAVKVVAHAATTPYGELLLRRGRCDGPPAARLALPDPATAPARLAFSAALPPGPPGDLCLLFTAPIDGPFYAIRSVAMRP